MPYSTTDNDGIRGSAMSRRRRLRRRFIGGRWRDDVVVYGVCLFGGRSVAELLAKPGAVAFIVEPQSPQFLGTEPPPSILSLRNNTYIGARTRKPMMATATEHQNPPPQFSRAEYPNKRNAAIRISESGLELDETRSPQFGHVAMSVWNSKDQTDILL